MEEVKELKSVELVYIMRGAAVNHFAFLGATACGTRIKGKKIASDTTHTAEELRNIVTCDKCIAGHRSAR